MFSISWHHRGNSPRISPAKEICLCTAGENDSYCDYCTTFLNTESRGQNLSRAAVEGFKMQGGLASLVHQGITEENAASRQIIEETLAGYQKQPNFFAALKV
jgi:hypothetical protein